jgi:hypothetical protein
MKVNDVREKNSRILKGYEECNVIEIQFHKKIQCQKRNPMQALKQKNFDLSFDFWKLVLIVVLFKWVSKLFISYMFRAWKNRKFDSE